MMLRALLLFLLFTRVHAGQTSAPVVPVARGAVVRELNLRLKPLDKAATPAELRAAIKASVLATPLGEAATPAAFAARAALVQALAEPETRVPALAASLRAAGGKKAEKAAERLERVGAALKGPVQPAVELLKLFDGASAAPGERVDLSAVPTVADGPSGKKARKKLAKENERLRELQERLVAEKRRAYLEMIQAIDTAGKDGVVKHGHRVNAAWTDVTAFKKPTPEEAKEDYKARINRRVPAKGRTGVHIRTIYEDIIAPLLFGTLPPDVIEARFADILRWEAGLMGSGVVLRKVFLHITKDVQRARLQARIDDPEKHWKFGLEDLETRKLWDKIQGIYAEVLARTSTVYAPWEIIGSDDKDARNLAYAKGSRKALERLDPQYPERPELYKVVIPK